MDIQIPNKHKLSSAWVYWEKRKAIPGLNDWNQLLLPLFEFESVEDFGLFWRKAPRIPDVFDQPKRGPANLIERKDERAGQTGKLTTKAEGYAIFRKGIRPDTGFKDQNGVKYCQGRKRAELAVRVDEFQSWQQAWETTVLAVIGELADPAKYLLGAYLNDKNGRGSVSLRMELWFSTNDEEIMHAIAEEITYHLKTALPDKRFNFVTPPYELSKEKKTGTGGDKDKAEKTVSSGGDRFGTDNSSSGGGFRNFDNSGPSPRGNWFNSGDKNKK